MRTLLVPAALLLLATACSSSDPLGSGVIHPAGTATPAPSSTSTTPPMGTGTTPVPPPPPPPVMTTTNTTWANGQTIAQSTVIMAGVTVTIAPGATVNLASGVTITVQGLLVGTSNATHAQLTGTSWGGIVVAGGGTLNVDSVDLANAKTAIEVQAGAAMAEYDDGIISGSSQPFSVDKGGALSTSHAEVTGTKGSSIISGGFTASYLNYDSNGYEGIVASDPTAVLSIEDSTLFGAGTATADMVVADTAASVHLAYTEIKEVHCAFHFNDPTAFDISYMNIHDNSYGFMLYGSGAAGTRSITYSNIFSNVAYGADEGSPTTVNGDITIANGYWAMNGASAATNLNRTTSAITVTNMSTTTPVTGVGPR